MRTERIASSSPKHSEAYGVQDFFLPTVHEMFPFSLDIDNKSIEFPEISPVSPCDSDHKNAASPSTSQHVSKENDIIDLTKEDKNVGTIEYWIKDLLLFPEDKHFLLNGEWLTDSIITATELLLKKDYPHIGGLQPTTLAEKFQFNVQRGDLFRY